MTWYILMKDGTKIVDFDLEDEWCIHQQICMEYGEWATLIGSFLHLTEFR